MARTISALTVALLLTPAWAQTGSSDDVVVPPGPVMNDAVQGGWSPAPMEKNAELWMRIAADDPSDGLKQLNNFRSVRNAALVRNQGELSTQDEEQLEGLVFDIERNVPNGFEAHLANYYLRFPDPVAFEHLEMASALDDQRSELIGPQLVRSIRSGDQSAVKMWAQKLKFQGNVASGLWLLSDDIFRSVDKDGILIAAGEMDAYPLWSKQYADGVRRDVLVIDARLLADGAYRRSTWQAANAKGSVPDGPERFIAEIANATTRPVFLSMALGPERVRRYGDKLRVSGLALRFGNPGTDHFELLEQRWAAMNKTTSAGPLSRNYLVFGAVLLKHYRAIDDEERASLLEHELRNLANAMGATDRLYRTGLLQH